MCGYFDNSDMSTANQSKINIVLKRYFAQNVKGFIVEFYNQVHYIACVQFSNITTNKKDHPRQCPGMTDTTGQ